MVTTLATSEHQWSSWSAFRTATALSGPLFAYALSFLVVSTFWWANHRFVSSLRALSPRAIRASLLMLAFVIYALNVAAVSLPGFLLFRVAIADRRYSVPLSRDEIVERTVNMLDVPLVFVASVPIGLFWSPSAARYSWLALVLLGVAESWWFARRPPGHEPDPAR